METAACAKPATGYTYARREPEKSALYQVLQQHLLTFEQEWTTVCPRCQTPLRLIAMIETEDTIKKILAAMGLPTEAPKLWPARPPLSQSGGEAGDWLN